MGEVCRAHGIKGHLYIRLFHEGRAWLPLVQKLHFTSEPSLEGKLLHTYSFFLKTFRPFQKGFLAVLQEIQTRNEATFFRGFQVYMSKVDLQKKRKKEGDMPFWVELTDFHLAHVEKKWEAPIVGILSHGKQLFLRVARKGEEEILIPFVKEWLVKRDDEKKILFFRLPEGIEDLNKDKTLRTRNKQGSKNRK